MKQEKSAVRVETLDLNSCFHQLLAFMSFFIKVNRINRIIVGGSDHTVISMGSYTLGGAISHCIEHLD